MSDESIGNYLCCMLNLPFTKEKAVADFKTRAEDQKCTLTATVLSIQTSNPL